MSGELMILRERRTQMMHSWDEERVPCIEHGHDRCTDLTSLRPWWSGIGQVRNPMMSSKGLYIGFGYVQERPVELFMRHSREVFIVCPPGDIGHYVFQAIVFVVAEDDDACTYGVIGAETYSSRIGLVDLTHVVFHAWLALDFRDTTNV